MAGFVSNNPQGATSGTHSAALSAGHNSQNDSISQNFSTLPGRVYAVDFDAGVFGQRTSNALQVRVEVIGSGTLLNQVITPPDARTFTPSAVTFQHFRFTFTANSSSAMLRFTSIGLGNANADQVIDTVAITQITQPGSTPTPTPTPTSTPTPTPTATPVPPPGPTPTVRISTTSTALVEGGSALITVSASSPPTTPLTITYSATGKATFGSDFALTGTPGQVVIPAGQTAAFFNFTALTDVLTTEKKESVKLKLNPGAGYKLPKGAGGKSVTIKITNVK